MKRTFGDVLALVDLGEQGISVVVHIRHGVAEKHRRRRWWWQTRRRWRRWYEATGGFRPNQASGVVLANVLLEVRQRLNPRLAPFDVFFVSGEVNLC